MKLPARSLHLGAGGSPVLLFLPGFLAPPSAYRALLTPVAAGGVEVVVPALYRPGPGVLSGRFGSGAEAERAIARAVVVLLPDAGHADLFDGTAGRLGSLSCGAGADPAGTRASIAAQLVALLVGG